MIIGVGTDIVNIARIEKLLEQTGKRFENRNFTAKEVEIAGKFSDNKAKSCHYAKRFAAKEAFSKALGLGIGRGVNFNDIEIFNDDKGNPYFNFSSKGMEFLKDYYKKYDFANMKFDLSMADDYPFAQAFVVISLS